MDTNIPERAETSAFPWKRGIFVLGGVMLATLIIIDAGQLVVELGFLGLTDVIPALAAAYKANRDQVIVWAGAGGYLLGFGLAIMYLRWLCGGGSVLTLVRGRWQDIKGKVWYTLGLGTIGFFVMKVLDIASSMLPLPSGTTPATTFALSLSGSALLAFAVQAAIMGPICEEILCRGFLYNMAGAAVSSRWSASLRWMSPYVAAIVSAAFFAGMHLSIPAFVALFLMGLVMAELYRRSGNIYASMFAHFLNNAFASVVVIAISLHGGLPAPAAHTAPVAWRETWTVASDTGTSSIKPGNTDKVVLGTELKLGPSRTPDADTTVPGGDTCEGPRYFRAKSQPQAEFALSWGVDPAKLGITGTDVRVLAVDCSNEMYSLAKNDAGDTFLFYDGHVYALEKKAAP